MATSGGSGQFPAIPDGGVGRGRWLERHSKIGDPFGGSREEGCSSVSLSTVVLSGDGDMAVVGRRSSWWQRWRGQGGALYSCGGRYGGRGACRWPKAMLNGEAASTGEEEGSWLDASTISYGGRWLRIVAGLAWRMRAVLGGQRSALGAEECSERQSRVGQELGGHRGRGGE
jgi:hypothetical protein